MPDLVAWGWGLGPRHVTECWAGSTPTLGACLCVPLSLLCLTHGTMASGLLAPSCDVSLFPLNTSPPLQPGLGSSRDSGKVPEVDRTGTSQPPLQPLLPLRPGDPALPQPPLQAAAPDVGFPSTRRFTCPFVEKFSIDIETFYKTDAGENPNVFSLSAVEKNQLTIGNYPNRPPSPGEDLSPVGPLPSSSCLRDPLVLPLVSRPGQLQTGPCPGREVRVQASMRAPGGGQD